MAIHMLNVSRIFFQISQGRVMQLQCTHVTQLIQLPPPPVKNKDPPPQKKKTKQFLNLQGTPRTLTCLRNGHCLDKSVI